MGGEVKVEKHEARALCYDPIEYIKEDLKIQEPGVELLRKCMGSVCEDYLTFDILKDYLPDTWRCPRCKRKKEKFVPVEE